MLFVYIFIEACAVSLVMPRRESLTAVLIEPSERARITGLIAALSFAITIPFGVFAGWLSNIDRRLPFIANIIIFMLAFVIIASSRKLLSERMDNKE
jgi:MFS family permease